MTTHKLTAIAKSDRERAKQILESQKTATLQAIIDGDETSEIVFEIAREVLDKREISGGLDSMYFETFEHDNDERVDSYTPAYA